MVVTRFLKGGFRCIAVLFAALLLSSVCCAEQGLVIFAHDNNPPYVSKGERGQAEGIVIDLLRLISDEMSCSFTYRLYPWKRAYYLSEKGNGAIIGISKTSKRLEVFDYSDVLYYHDIAVVVRKGETFPFNSVEDLAGKKVAVHRGSSYSDDYDKALASGLFHVDATNSREERLSMLLNERVDAALIGDGRIGVNLACERLPALRGRADRFTVLAKPLVRDLNYLAVPRRLNVAAFIKEFNQALKKCKTSGAFEAIQERYIQKNLER